MILVKLRWDTHRMHAAFNIPPHSLPSSKVRVLFTHPLYAGMKPCPFFMDGGCKFSEEDCKFSHGLVVEVNQLKRYEEHDFR